MSQSEKPYKLKRECGNCTMCCQGWLPGKAHGHSFYSGKPCHFVDCNGCSIYEYRPESPCKSYNCSWLVDDFFPQWFKPNESKIICNWIKWKEIKSNGCVIEDSYYLSVIECGEKIDSKYYNWLILKQHEDKFNLFCMVDGGAVYLGENDFIQFMTKVKTKENGTETN